MRCGADRSNEELIFLAAIIREKDVTGLNQAINRTSVFRSESDLYPQAGVLCLCVVRLSVILHQQSGLNQGRKSASYTYSHDMRVSSLSTLNQVMSLVTAATVRYFARALQKGGDQLSILST